MDERAFRLQIDTVTGKPTSLWTTRSLPSQRASCSALNRTRARGILAAINADAPGKPLSINVWKTAFEGAVNQWEVPLVSLEKLGFDRTDLGLIAPKTFLTLKYGAEAEPYLHRESGMVYKLFNLRITGALGKKLTIEEDGSEGFDIKQTDANLVETMEKIQVLHDMGAHPTEIVGLSDMGDFLVVKQQVAQTQNYNTRRNASDLGIGDLKEFEIDSHEAILSIKAESIRRPGLRGKAVFSWLDGQPWLVSDLHPGNIMRNQQGEPTIIDALTGPVPPAVIRKLTWLEDEISYLKRWRQEGRKPERRSLLEEDQDELAY